MRLVVTFPNGSTWSQGFPHVADLYDYANFKVSHSNIKRMEMVRDDESVRALWDRDWTDESKAAGLRMPL